MREEENVLSIHFLYTKHIYLENHYRVGVCIATLIQIRIRIDH